MKKLIFFFVLMAVAMSSTAHPWKPAHYVIVDTDCGLDDMRALTLLLSSSSVRVLAITASNGIVDAASGYQKINQLLKEYHHEGVLVGINPDTSVRAENCKQAFAFNWGNTTTIYKNIIPLNEIIQRIITQIPGKISFVSLGSLNTYEQCIKSIPGFSSHIDTVFWSINSSKQENEFNYRIDTGAYLFAQTLSIPVAMIGATNANAKYSDDMISQLVIPGNDFSHKFIESITQPESDFAKVICDEWVAIYLHKPNWFTKDQQMSYKFNPTEKSDSIKTELTDILNGNTVNKNQVLARFPIEMNEYFPDVQRSMASTLQSYGYEEWVACVLTNELHRHLGVYAVVGAKMGVRAKEYFGAGIDEMRIVSHAGSIPPYSCMNDGLQVSTGATLGHGLISVSNDKQILPQAEFEYLGQKIILELKPEYRQKLEKEIKELVVIYGIDSNAYWELVRLLAIKCWNTWDRHDIFIITKE